MVAKHSINLLQAELFPEKALLSLPRMLIIWLSVLVLMVTWALVVEFNYNESAKNHAVLSQEKQQQSQLAKQLESQLQNRQVSPDLAQSLSTMKLVMRHKDALLHKLTDSNETFAGGFVMVMNDLSVMHHKDIRLKNHQH